MCPACWTPNRARDRRCIGCRRPFELATGDEADAYRMPEHIARDRRHVPRFVGFLVVTVGVLWILYAVADAVMYVGGVVVVVAAAVSAGATRTAVFTGIFGGLLGVVVLAFAWLYYKLGMKIIDGARWAWLVGFILSVLPVLGWLVLEADTISPVSLPAWFGLGMIPYAYVASVLLLALLIDLARVVIPQRRG